MKKLSKLIAFACIMTLVACSAPKKVAYLVDADTIPEEVLSQTPVSIDPTIMPGDLLNIAISSPDYASVAPFNKGMYVSQKDAAEVRKANQNTSNMGTSVDTSTEYYLVDAKGNIELPIVGTLHVGGLTKQEVAEEVKKALSPRYVKDPPTVDIRLMNFRVTVTGAVKAPGIYEAKNERMNILEALTMAGDLDIKGERENIMLIRTEPDGSRKVVRLNIHDKNVLMSPYFTLQQNDFIYVEPNPSMKQNSWQLNSAVGTTLTVVGGLSSVVALVISIITLSRL